MEATNIKQSWAAASPGTLLAFIRKEVGMSKYDMYLYIKFSLN
jgi:hypothetical protein